MTIVDRMLNMHFEILRSRCRVTKWRLTEDQAQTLADLITDSVMASWNMLQRMKLGTMSFYGILIEVRS